MSSAAFLKAASAPSTPEDHIEAAYERHGGGLAVTTSFGAQSEILLHRVTRIIPRIPVLFIDTGYLFDETHQHKEKLVKLLDLNLFTYRPLRSAAEQETAEGRRWTLGAAAMQSYNLENKVEPMNRAMLEQGVTGWLAGLRRAQHEERRNIPFVETTQGGIRKYYPHRDMTDADVRAYRLKHDLPEHPLVTFGYHSIGDWHSSAPGTQHAFCGLHEIKAAPRDDVGHYVI